MKKLKITKGKWFSEVIDGQLKILTDTGTKTCKIVAVIAVPKYVGLDEYETSKEEALNNAKLICELINNYKNEK